MATLPAHDQRRVRLGDGERVPDGVRRIARGQLDMSIERLEGDTDEDLGTAVHETRKSLKRLRATVRLARNELGDEAYRRENVAFRDAGRRLGGARDSQVLLETLDALTDRYPDEAPPERFARFKRTLVGQHGAAPKKMKRIARRAHELSNLTGEDHDLALLAEQANERRDRFPDATAAGEVTALVERRRDELQRGALELARRLFRNKPAQDR